MLIDIAVALVVPSPTVNFETLKTEIPESLTVVKIPVVLSETTDSIVKIPLKFSGTATKDDYTILTETLILQAHQKKGFIELDIINDKIKEQDETILIELQNPINATLGEQFNYSYTIINEDSKIIIPKKHLKKNTQLEVKNLKKYVMELTYINITMMEKEGVLEGL